MPTIKELQEATNVAELLDEQELSRISSQVVKGYEVDEMSRAEWKATVENAMDIAKQTEETKNSPWPKSSNVKFPLITQASIDFASRVLPEIIQNDKVVRVSLIGQDPEGIKMRRGNRVAKHMSYQLLHESDAWEEGMDKLLHILPILGTVFKKVYYHPVLKRPVSEVCYPDKIVVNYNISTLEEARRVTHLLSFHTNDIIERIRLGIYRDIDVETLRSSEGYLDGDEDAPVQLLEQHCYLDLDGDGYQEPYVVILHEKTGEILRIAARFDKVELTEDGKVQRISPEQYFADYHFIKSPDGGFYSMGFGSLLYPLNAAINTLLNQLIDSGTLNNSQAGFIGRGLRLKNGEFKFKLGEWRVLDAASGVDLKNNIVPLPTKEPSPTLFQLLGLLIDIGKDLASTNEALQGKQPAQNVSATTMLTLVEQGMKVFSAINKRLFRAMKKEFLRIYDLNKDFLSNKEYMEILDDPEANVKTDYESASKDLIPVADPELSTMAQRLAKAQAVAQIPGIDPRAMGIYFLEALQIDAAKMAELLPEPDPNAPPPPEVIRVMAESEKFKAEAQAKLADIEMKASLNMLEVEKIKLQAADTEARVKESDARVGKMERDAEMNDNKVELAAAKATHQALISTESQEHKELVDAIELALREREVKVKEKQDGSK